MIAYQVSGRAFTVENCPGIESDTAPIAGDPDEFGEHYPRIIRT
jgi:hypothetical protein